MITNSDEYSCTVTGLIVEKGKRGSTAFALLAGSAKEGLERLQTYIDRLEEVYEINVTRVDSLKEPSQDSS